MIIELGETSFPVGDLKQFESSQKQDLRWKSERYRTGQRKRTPAKMNITPIRVKVCASCKESEGEENTTSMSFGSLLSLYHSGTVLLAWTQIKKCVRHARTNLEHFGLFTLSIIDMNQIPAMGKT